MSFQYLVGIHSVEQTLASAPDKVISLLICDKKKLNGRQLKVVEQAQSLGVPVENCSEKFLDEQHPNHQGIAAKLKESKVWSEATLLDYLEPLQDPLILLLDEVQDPHNVGAILRTAAAFNVAAVVTPEKNACSLTPAVRKTASGGDLIVPFAQVKNLARFMRTLKDQNFWIIGTALGPESKDLSELDLKGPIAIVLGAEGTGIRKNTQEHCDFLAKIPMNEAMNSLNVSVACGVVLYESFKQRLS